jgi:hypothetical protein
MQFTDDEMRNDVNFIKFIEEEKQPNNNKNFRYSYNKDTREIKSTNLRSPKAFKDDDLLELYKRYLKTII